MVCLILKTIFCSPRLVTIFRGILNVFFAYPGSFLLGLGLILNSDWLLLCNIYFSIRLPYSLFWPINDSWQLFNILIYLFLVLWWLFFCQNMSYEFKIFIAEECLHFMLLFYAVFVLLFILQISFFEISVTRRYIFVQALAWTCLL